MKGMDRNTGKWLEGEDHLKQSIAHILTTRLKGVMRLSTYGSDLPDLVDKPLTPLTIQKVLVASIKALNLWEPRIEVQSAQINQDKADKGILEIHFNGHLTDGTSINLPVQLQ